MRSHNRGKVVIKQKRSRAHWEQYARLWPDTLTGEERQELLTLEQARRTPIDPENKPR